MWLIIHFDKSISMRLSKTRSALKLLLSQDELH